MTKQRLFLIEAEQAIRILFEDLFEGEVYTLADFSDVSFRLPDFAPELVLIGASLFLEDPEMAQSELEVCADIPCALVGREEELSKARGLGWAGGELKKPLKVSTLRQSLLELLS